MSCLAWELGAFFLWNVLPSELRIVDCGVCHSVHPSVSTAQTHAYVHTVGVFSDALSEPQSDALGV